MLKVKDFFKPQLITSKFYFADNLGELYYDHEMSRDGRIEFIRNYGECRVIDIGEYNHTIHFTFNLPQCPIFDIECPYANVEGLSCQCLCGEPFDNCDEMQYHMMDLDTRNYKGE